ncbi:MAG: hypothetical protein KKC71_06370 [Chloroflexi bacterium]|nr:hypothetical protein [Chloroflexota bacterium]
MHAKVVTPALQGASRDHAVVILTGARQVGKSTLLLNAEPFRDWRLLAIEVKRSDNPGYGDAAGLRAFLSEYPNASGGLLVHGGREIRRLDEKILAILWTMVTG